MERVMLGINDVPKVPEVTWDAGKLGIWPVLNVPLVILLAARLGKAPVEIVEAGVVWPKSVLKKLWKFVRIVDAALPV
jgi:hypothetical protein